MRLEEQAFLMALGMAFLFILGAVLCNYILDKFLGRRKYGIKGQKRQDIRKS